MIAIEAFLTVIFPLLLILAVAGYFVWRKRDGIRAFWQRWYQHDLALEEEARKEQKQRREAEEEVKTWAAPAYNVEETPQVQPVRQTRED